jgi:tricorn protease
MTVNTIFRRRRNWQNLALVPLLPFWQREAGMIASGIQFSHSRAASIIPRGSSLRSGLLSILLLAGGLGLTARAGENAVFMRFPTLHGDAVVFEAHGNLWRVNRDGGVASRLTSEPGFDLMPRFSPDGKWIAFTGQYQGNRDVYVIASTGGAARRLTFHSDVVDDAPLRWGPDNMVVTWTPDSSNIVYLSRRDAWNSWYGRLFRVPVEGGPSEALPLDSGGLLSYRADGKEIAYNRIFRNFRTWKRYDGGLGQDIDIYDFETTKLTHVTDWSGTETAPMWYGDTIYFLSDHDSNRRGNIWAVDVTTKNFRQITHFTDYDIDFPSLGDNGIVFQQGGSLYVLDLPTEQLHKIDVSVPDDGTHTNPRFVDAGKFIRDADAAGQTDYDVAPNGKRAIFTARGDLFSVPAEHGNTRNLTESSDADEDHPAWSPDGTRVAYTTDIDGEQQIALRPAKGGKETVLTHFSQGFLYQPVWAPGSDKLAFSDNEHRLWVLDVAKPEPKLVAQDRYQEIHDYTWSPDGRWLGYSATDDNQVRSIFLYQLENGNATRISAGRDNDSSPVFDPEGTNLYFVSSRRENPVLSESEFDAANLKSSGIFVTPLAADAASPFAPRSDEGVNDTDGKTAGAPDSAKAKEPVDAASPKGEGKGEWKAGASAPIHIDLDGLMTRAVPLPVPAAEVQGLDVRKGKVFFMTAPLHTIGGQLPGEKAALHVFDLAERKDAVVVEDLGSYRLSADGEKVLYKKDKGWSIVDAKAPGDGGAPGANSEKKSLDLAHLRIQIDPRQEWREMFESAWRLERDFFYNTKMNGVDWNAVRSSYEKLLPLVGSREDLNYLIGEVQGELGNSHTYVGGGDEDNPTESVHTGFLGADIALDPSSGRYYFARIFTGDNTREGYRAPLAQPGIKVAKGDYLLAVDGHELKAPTDPYSLFVGKDEGTVTLTIADSPNAKGRDIVVEPVKSELPLREQQWIEHNRSVVDQLSGGKIAYVYIVDMEQLGMQQFMRQFYNQIDREALIVDDRWNHGGFIDQIVLERLRRILIGMATSRQRVAMPNPQQLIIGPKACLINHYSASDGDLFPYYFRQYGLGPLIGTRTWGGVRGIRGDWPLLDGGYITVPEDSMYGLDSQWIIENHGVVPDIEVDDSPADILADNDVQLKTAVTNLLNELKQKPATLPPPPPLLPAFPPPGHQ